MHRLTSGLHRFGDELCEDTGLRGLVREHPFVVTGLFAVVAGGIGFLAGPSLVRAIASKWSSIGGASKNGDVAMPALAGAPKPKSNHAHLVSVAMRAMRAVMTVPRR